MGLYSKKPRSMSEQKYSSRAHLRNWSSAGTDLKSWSLSPKESDPLERPERLERYLRREFLIFEMRISSRCESGVPGSKEMPTSALPTAARCFLPRFGLLGNLASLVTGSLQLESLVVFEVDWLVSAGEPSEGPLRRPQTEDPGAPVELRLQIRNYIRRVSFP